MWEYFSFDGELFHTITECQNHEDYVISNMMNSLDCSEL